MSAGRVHRLESEYDVTVRYTYFPLHPETPDEGRSLLDLFAGREAGFRESARRLKVLMAEEGLEYGERTHTYNSRLAQELAAAGDEAGVTDALHAALYRAYFVDGANIGSHDVLREISEAVGLDDEVVEGVLEARSHRGTIDEHWQRALGMGVSGVPTFAAGGYGVVGAQPYDVLQTLMTRVGAEQRSP